MTRRGLCPQPYQGEAVGGYNIKELNIALKRIKLTATFFMTIPGPKMLWQFQELGYDYPRRTTMNDRWDRSLSGGIITLLQREGICMTIFPHWRN
jgi:hypothetical protein